MHIRDHRRSFSGWTDPCSLGHRPASFRLGDFRSVAALVPFGSLRTVGGRAGYSVVKVQLKEVFIYSDICDPESQGTGERFLKILSLIRK